MSLETDIVEAVRTLGYDIYPDTAAQGTPYPYVVFMQVGGTPSNALCGNSDGQNARIQFNVWASTRDDASTIMRAVEAVLTQPPFRAVSLGSLVAEYNAVPKAYGARQDLSFWFRP